MSAPRGVSLAQEWMARHSLTRSSLNKSGKESVAKGGDAYMQPYKISKEEKSILVNLRDHLLLHFDGNIDAILPYSLHELESLLVLEVPKKIEAHKVMKADVSNIKVIEQTTDLKSKKKGAISKSIVKPVRTKRSNFDYSVAAENSGDEESSVKKGRFDDYYDELSTKVIEKPRQNCINLYEVLNEVFNIFWDMEFPDDQTITVKAAFFAKIDCHNCVDFGLTTFATESCCLPIIKERLESKDYKTLDDAVFDFNTMFENIFKYYHPEHLAYHKAIELKAMLQSEIEKAKARLIWS